METLNQLLQGLDKVQGLSAVALVFLSCIVVGYILRFIKAFPNDGIPVVVILWGAVAMLFIADPRVSTMEARIWTSRNLFVGLIIGAVAWFTHKILISRLENLIASKFPQVNDTTLFSRKDSDVSQPPNPPVAPTPKTP